MNRYFYVVIIITVIILSCNPKSNKEKGYIINGNITGIENGKVILSKLDLVTNEKVNVDSTEIINGKFTFKGHLDSPYIHTLYFNNSTDNFHFFLENSTITILGDNKSIRNSRVIGSREDSIFRSYKMEDIFDRKKGMEIMFKHPDYSFAAFTAYYQFQLYNISPDTLETIMTAFKKPLRESEYFFHLQKLYKTIKKVGIFQSAPQFSVPDTTGTLYTNTDFKGKYVLIDFWASWCAPCRASNPKLVEVYKQYAHRNFTIVGISVDKDKKQWVRALKADKLPWPNVSNLKGWGKVSQNYGVKAVPQNFLLDPNGIIIDKNIEPKALKEKLKTLLQ